MDIEALIFVVVAVFYVVRAIYRGLRRVAAGARTALGMSPQLSAAEARRRGLEQIPGQTPSQRAGMGQSQAGPAPRQAPGARAGESALTVADGRERRRASTAEAEAGQAVLPPSAGMMPEASARPDTSPLFSGKDDLVRAVILQEILARPLSQRRGIRSDSSSPSLPH